MNINEMRRVIEHGTATVKLCDFDGNPIRFQDDGRQMSITVRSPHSPEGKEVQRRHAKRILSKGGAVNKKNEIDPEKLDLIEEAEIQRLADLTAGWDLSLDGEKPEPFTRQAAIDLYTALPHFATAVGEALSDMAGFTTKPKGK